jgi:pimeloyl-ACP methyl ester carboxylesterase
LQNRHSPVRIRLGPFTYPYRAPPLRTGQMTEIHDTPTPGNYTEVLELPVGRELELGALIGPRGSAVELGCDFVVYFPGLGVSKEYFQGCLTSPSLERFTGLAIDPLGMGDSALPSPDQQGYGILEQAQLVNRALDLLVDRGLCKSISIVAHSWGEAVALAALQQKSRDIKRYVSVSGGVTGGLLESPERYLSEQFIEAMLPQMLSQVGPITGNPSPKERILGRRILRECISSFINERDSLLEVFRALPCRRYFMRGADDMCAGVDGFDAKIEIPGSGHNVILEAPESFTVELSRLL